MCAYSWQYCGDVCFTRSSSQQKWAGSGSVNMSAPLAVCTKEEQRAVIWFLWSEGVKGAEIHCRLLAQYGDSTLPWSSVFEWIEKFKSGRTTVMQEEGAGCPSTSTMADKIEQAQLMVLTNRRVTIDDVASTLNISHGSAYTIFHDELDFRKVCLRWVPRQLTEEHNSKDFRSANAYSTITTEKVSHFWKE